MNRTAVITGASSGIGRAIAEKMLEQGHAVIGLARDFRKFQPNDTNFSPVELDLSDLKILPEKLRALSERYPQIDTIVLSAGRGQFGSLEEFSYTQINALMNVNFTGQVFVARALIPVLKRKHRGDVIVIGSEAALTGKRNGAIYCASKFALRGFTQALREECSGSGIRVAIINPGMVKTAFFDALHFEPGPDGHQSIGPEDIGELVALMLRLGHGTNLDEINLTPLQKVVQFKPRGKKNQR